MYSRSDSPAMKNTLMAVLIPIAVGVVIAVAIGVYCKSRRS